MIDQSTVERVPVIRKIPVEVSLVECEIEGERRWCVVYAAQVDGQDVSAAAVSKVIGAEMTPQGAMNAAAERIGPFGF